jgi:regulator of sigma E protease
VIRSSKGKPVEIMLKRDGEQKMLTVHPVLSNMDGGAERWMIGVLPAQKFNIETTQLSFPDALQESVRQNLKGATLIFQFLEGIIERRMSARSLEGPSASHNSLASTPGKGPQRSSCSCPWSA